MKLLAIDGNSILNRSFYGVKLLSAKNGTHTNALVGFLNILLKMIHEIAPDEIVVAFDLHAPTFRHKMYAEYKGTRKGMPEELQEQMPLAKEIIRMLGYSVLELEGYEADDIVGTLSRLCCSSGNECIIASGDRDCLQLITDCVTIRLATTREAIHYTPERYREEFGIDPIQLIDVKALMGDSSDNIPGVKGIGEKSAYSLVSKYGSLETIYENLNGLEVTPRVKKLLAEGRESAFMSKELATIFLEVPIPQNLDAYQNKPMDNDGLCDLFNRLEMYSFIEKFGLEEAGPAVAEQLSSSHPPLEVIKNPDYQTVRDALTECSTLDFLVLFEKDNVSVLHIHAVSAIYCFDFNAEQALAELILPSSLPKRTNDIKRLYRHLLQQGLELNGVVFDLMIAAYLLDAAGRSYEISLLAKKYELPPIAVAEEYQSIAYLPLLCDMLHEELSATGMLRLMDDIEMPLSLVLASMEKEGFEVDVKGVKRFGDALYTQIELLKSTMFEMIGYSFNPNSTNDLKEILFVRLGLTPKKKTKSGYSTDAETLESIRHEHAFVPLLLEYRKLTKLYSTYVTGLLKVVDHEGRVHSTFKQTETRTGRISSTEPNMQNIPTRTELGREMRRFFIAKDGYTLVDADYSQIELRILAHLSGDERMIYAFNHNADIHAITASEVFNVPLESVTLEMRTRAKAINFGIVYGIGAFSLSQDIGVTVAQASHYINEYLTTYHGVDQFMKHTVETSKETGYAITMFGRRRILDELRSHNKNIRNFGERAAMNAPIQGSAADIIKIAMIKVYQRLKKEQIDGKLILQVHDELILEVAEKDAERAKLLLKEEMEQAAALKVALTVDVSSGKTWYDAKE